MIANRPTPDTGEKLKPNPAKCSRVVKVDCHGSVLIAAITSARIRAIRRVIAAGFAREKAVERGLRVDPAVNFPARARFARCFRLSGQTGLQKYLDELGFNLVGYVCTTCIGNSGPLHPKIEKAIHEFDLVAASVLSGNRNFEAARAPKHQSEFSVSPPLVVAFALGWSSRHRSFTRTAREV